MFKKQENSIV